MGKKKVVVLGGGVAGMTAAHELIERGFDVVVYERKRIAGGKARSMPVPDSGKEGRPDLPGEHGFRFVPGFYKHLPDTMGRIPFEGNPNGVLGNLVSVAREEFARTARTPLIALSRFPQSWADLKVLLEMPKEFEGLGLTTDDFEFFFSKIWQVLTSCQERRLLEYERVGWWEFVDAANRSKAYQTYLAIGATRTLVASKAELANTKTIGDIGIQLMLNVATIGESSDRILNGPTNDVWINPWLEYLRSKGVDYRFGTVVEQILCPKEAITGVVINDGTGPVTVTGDYYICALPVEVISGLVTKDLIAADPMLADLAPLAEQVNWMNGIQFYLFEDVPILAGHEMYLESPWALTSLSQQQFWPNFDLKNYGDGKVRGVISVDVSDWTSAGIRHGPAKDCTRDEIIWEVWEQLKQGLNVDGKVLLKDENRHSWFIDSDIEPGKKNPHTEVNLEPLLVNLIDSWHLRPDAYTAISNLYLASDYIRTHTDLACMEAANEAARRAVNAILSAENSSQPYCKIFPLHDPDILIPLRFMDKERFENGLPWTNEIAKPLGWLNKIKNAVEGALGG